MTIEDNKKLHILNLKKEIKNFLIRNSSIFSSRITNSRRDKIIDSFNKSKINFNMDYFQTNNSEPKESITPKITETIYAKEHNLIELNKIDIKDDKSNKNRSDSDLEIVSLESKIEIPQVEIKTDKRIDLDKKEEKLDPRENIKALSKLKINVEFCKRCELSKSRTKSVFGSGSGNIKLVCVGEAPGEDEDKQGLPFVGKSGQLLTKMLEAININRDDIFITNVIKCRPPLNRDPNEDEIKKCSLYLDEQLQVLKPKYILALGRVAAKRLLNLDYSMKKFREEIQNYKGIPVIVTYHPSALLRNQNWKRPSWEDLQKLQKLLKD